MTNPAEKELKTCPFCGGDAEFQRWMNNGVPFVDAVICLGCGCEKEGKNCIKKWNTRIAPQVTDEMVERAARKMCIELGYVPEMKMRGNSTVGTIDFTWMDFYRPVARFSLLAALNEGEA